MWTKSGGCRCFFLKHGDHNAGVFYFLAQAAGGLAELDSAQGEHRPRGLK